MAAVLPAPPVPLVAPAPVPAPNVIMVLLAPNQDHRANVPASGSSNRDSDSGGAMGPRDVEGALDVVGLV